MELIASMLNTYVGADKPRIIEILETADRTINNSTDIYEEFIRWVNEITKEEEQIKIFTMKDANIFLLNHIKLNMYISKPTNASRFKTAIHIYFGKEYLYTFLFEKAGSDIMMEIYKRQTSDVRSKMILESKELKKILKARQLCQI